MARHYPNLFHSPPTGTAAAVSAFAVAVMGKKLTSHVDTVGAVSAHRAGRKKPCSSAPARPPRRHDFARHRTDFQPPNSGHTCLIGVLCGAQYNHKVYSTTQKKCSNRFCTHHLRLERQAEFSFVVGVRLLLVHVQCAWIPAHLPVFRTCASSSCARQLDCACGSAVALCTSAARTVGATGRIRCLTVTNPFAIRSVACPVPLRPELHLRRFHHRPMSSHRRRPAIPRILRG